MGRTRASRSARPADRPDPSPRPPCARRRARSPRRSSPSSTRAANSSSVSPSPISRSNASRVAGGRCTYSAATSEVGFCVAQELAAQAPEPSFRVDGAGHAEVAVDGGANGHGRAGERRALANEGQGFLAADHELRPAIDGGGHLAVFGERAEHALAIDLRLARRGRWRRRAARAPWRTPDARRRESARTRSRPRRPRRRQPSRSCRASTARTRSLARSAHSTRSASAGIMISRSSSSRQRTRRRTSPRRRFRAGDEQQQRPQKLASAPTLHSLTSRWRQAWPAARMRSSASPSPAATARSISGHAAPQLLDEGQHVASRWRAGCHATPWRRTRRCAWCRAGWWSGWPPGWSRQERQLRRERGGEREGRDVRQMALRRHQSIVHLGIDGHGLAADACPEVGSGGDGIRGGRWRADRRNRRGPGRSRERRRRRRKTRRPPSDDSPRTGRRAVGLGRCERSLPSRCPRRSPWRCPSGRGRRRREAAAGSRPGPPAARAKPRAAAASGLAAASSITPLRSAADRAFGSGSNPTTWPSRPA